MGVAVVCRNDQAASLSEPVDECPEVLSRKLAFGLRGKQRKCIVLLSVAMNERFVRPSVPIEKMWMRCHFAETVGKRTFKDGRIGVLPAKKERGGSLVVAQFGTARYAERLREAICFRGKLRTASFNANRYDASFFRGIHNDWQFTQ